jgi:hypothetical protein|tara:strand:- start:192 stop:515 length:324 start_codon:yes stop_codon:yes gene_type:complete
MSVKTGDQKDVYHSDQKKSGRGNNPESRANLKPWKKGISGNPGGRPQKNERFIKALKSYGNKNCVDMDGVIRNDSWSKEVVERIWADAARGNYQAIKLLMDLGSIEP